VFAIKSRRTSPKYWFSGYCIFVSNCIQMICAKNIWNLFKLAVNVVLFKIFRIVRDYPLCVMYFWCIIYIIIL